MASTLVSPRNTTSDIVDTFGLESLLSPLGVLPMLVGGIDDHIALLQVRLKSVNGFVSNCAMWDAEHKVFGLVAGA